MTGLSDECMLEFIKYILRVPSVVNVNNIYKENARQIIMSLLQQQSPVHFQFTISYENSSFSRGRNLSQHRIDIRKESSAAQPNNALAHILGGGDDEQSILPEKQFISEASASLVSFGLCNFDSDYGLYGIAKKKAR